MGIQTEDKSNVVKTKFTESLMDSAKRKSITGLLDSSKIPYFKQSDGYASQYCPECGMSHPDSNKCNISNELWNCWSCGAGGSVVDYAMALWGMTATEAAKKLVGETIAAAKLKPGESSESKKNEVDLTEFYKAIQLRGKTYNKEAVDYLVNERAIPEKVINEAIHRGLLRFLPGGPHENAKFLRECFGDAELKRLGLWREGSRIPWVAFRPIIFILPSMKSAEWRIAADPKDGEKKAVRFGADKSFWYWQGSDSSKVNVVEGAIDMLSMVALGWAGDIKAIPGTSVWDDQWIDGYDYATFTLDNDVAGLTAMIGMMNAANEKKIRSVARSPKKGDINAELKSRRKAA